MEKNSVAVCGLEKVEKCGYDLVDMEIGVCLILIFIGVCEPGGSAGGGEGHGNFHILIVSASTSSLIVVLSTAVARIRSRAGSAHRVAFAHLSVVGFLCVDLEIVAVLR